MARLKVIHTEAGFTKRADRDHEAIRLAAKYGSSPVWFNGLLTTWAFLQDYRRDAEAIRVAHKRNPMALGPCLYDTGCYCGTCLDLNLLDQRYGVLESKGVANA